MIHQSERTNRLVSSMVAMQAEYTWLDGECPTCDGIRRSLRPRLGFMWDELNLSNNSIAEILRENSYHPIRLRMDGIDYRAWEYREDLTKLTDEALDRARILLMLEAMGAQGMSKRVKDEWQRLADELNRRAA